MKQNWRQLGAVHVVHLVCILDVVGWLLGATAYFVSQSDQATAGFDEAAGMIITVLFAITVVPAFALVLTSKLPTMPSHWRLPFQRSSQSCSLQSS